MKTITLATFDTPAQAEPLKHRLEELHIAAWIHGGRALKRLWFVAKPIAEVKLDVRAEDFEKSVRLMHELEAEEALMHDLVRCPECHSSRVEYPQFTRKFLFPNLIGLVSALGIVEKKYYCEDCHHTWAPAGRKPRRVRAHMAPFYFLEGVPEEKPETKK
jgi:hypothetical protein